VAGSLSAFEWSAVAALSIPLAAVLRRASMAPTAVRPNSEAFCPSSAASSFTCEATSRMLEVASLVRSDPKGLLVTAWFPSMLNSKNESAL
jgi:hypothetical protein